MYIEYCYGPKWPYLIYIAYIGLFGTGICRFIQVLYLGIAPRTKETLPDFREKCRVTRHSRVFRGLTGSQWTPGFWGVTNYTRPDIPFSINLLARCSSAPTKRHWNGIKHILRYLRWTSDMGLFYFKAIEPQLLSYGDVRYLSNPHKARSQTGYIYLLMEILQYPRDQLNKRW